jgi:hypothetical protein
MRKLSNSQQWQTVRPFISYLYELNALDGKYYGRLQIEKELEVRIEVVERKPGIERWRRNPS